VSVGVGAVSRAVKSIHAEPVVALDKRREMLGYDQLTETEEQYQLPISGTASDVIAWTEREVSFGTAFIDASDMRDSNLVVPHFTFGVMLESEPVAVTAVVREWLEQNDTVVGARVSVGAYSPGSTVDFRGYVHLTFQGFGAPVEEGADLDADG
jgi:hypothetical protein